MIELAEDERQVFTERMVAEALKGKTPSESPTFYALVGAPGSGKSTLASTIDNAVVISSDHVIAEYAKTLGIDIREDFCDREVGRFATVVSNEIYKAAVKNKMNIVYDTSVLQNTFKMLEHVPKFGYQTKLKIMLVDEYQAAMNVVERKMDNDDAFPATAAAGKVRLPFGQSSRRETEHVDERVGGGGRICHAGGRTRLSAGNLRIRQKRAFF